MSVSKVVRRKVFERDGYRCQYCRLTVSDGLPEYHPRRATVDHVIPCSKGGSKKMDNLVTSCRRCNEDKAAMSVEAYRWYRHMVLRGHSREELLTAVREVEQAPVAQ